MKILLSPVKARVQRKSGYASPQAKGRTQDGSGLLLSEKNFINRVNEHNTANSELKF